MLTCLQSIAMTFRRPMTNVADVLYALALFTLMPGAIANATAQPATLQDYRSIRGPQADATYRYGPASSQYAELFLPKGAPSAPLPVAIVIHGGCWLSTLGGMPQFRALSAALAQHGIAVWNIEYRRIDESGGGFPGTYQDIRAALDLLATQANAHHLDMNRLVAVGHSAGAQLALWAAAQRHIPLGSPLYSAQNAIPKIATVISLGGILDLHVGGDGDPDPIRGACGIDPRALTGDPSTTRPNVYADTSPADMLPIGVNILEINGAEDGVAPPSLAHHFAEQAIAAGDKVTVKVIPEASHFDEVIVGSPAWPALLNGVLAALKR